MQRGDLILVYTAVPAEFADIIMSAPELGHRRADVERGGRNLAAQAIHLLRQPSALPKARLAPYPRLQALLSVLADAELDHGDPDNLRFRLPGDSARPLRLDEVALPTSAGHAVANRDALERGSTAPRTLDMVEAGQPESRA